MSRGALWNDVVTHACGAPEIESPDRVIVSVSYSAQMSEPSGGVTAVIPDAGGCSVTGRVDEKRIAAEGLPAFVARLRRKWTELTAGYKS